MLGVDSTSTPWTLMCKQITWGLGEMKIFNLPLKKMLKFCISKYNYLCPSQPSDLLGTSLDCFLVVLIKVGSVLWMG